MIEDFLTPRQGCRHPTRKTIQPRAYALGFVLTRFQRSGSQPSQDLREDDRFGCIRHELSYSGIWKAPQAGTQFFLRGSAGSPPKDCGDDVKE